MRLTASKRPLSGLTVCLLAYLWNVFLDVSMKSLSLSPSVCLYVCVHTSELDVVKYKNFIKLPKSLQFW